MARNTIKFSNRVKAGLALNGTTLAAWARTKGYPMTTVWQAIHLKRKGPVTRRIREELRTLHA